MKISFVGWEVSQRRSEVMDLCQRRLYGMARASYGAVFSLYGAVESMRDREREGERSKWGRGEAYRGGERERRAILAQERRDLRDAEMSLHRLTR